MRIDKIEETILEEHCPRKKWFFNDYTGLHGIGHSVRVLLLSEIIGRSIKKRGLCVDLESLRWSVSIHDTQRKTNSYDPQHGKRAEEWFIRNIKHKTLNKSLISLMLREHDRLDYERMPIELSIMKDADELDRWRTVRPKKETLRTEEAELLYDLSREFYNLSKQYLKQYKDELVSVIESGRSLSLLK